MAGGPCACNAEPLADFLTCSCWVRGRCSLPDVCDTILAGRKAGLSKHDILVKLAQIPGVYVPSLYDVSYFPDGRVQKVEPRCGAPAVVTKAILPDMNAQPLPRNFVVPMIGAVHDRAHRSRCASVARLRANTAAALYKPFHKARPVGFRHAGRVKSPCASVRRAKPPACAKAASPLRRSYGRNDRKNLYPCFRCGLYLRKAVFHDGPAH